MRRSLALPVMTLGTMCACAEIIDRIAVTVDRLVITRAELARHVRVAGLLNGEAAIVNPESLRAGAERMIELVLIRREMALSRFAEPAMTEIEPILAKVKQEGSASASWETLLRRHEVSEEEVRESLLAQLTTLRFVRIRFRPAVAIEEREIERYYREKFAPETKPGGNRETTSLEDARDQIELLLTEQKIDQALDQWLAQARRQVRVTYRAEAFQ